MILGISYIHSKRILHRDLKPQNIFLTKNMDIKIGDLGLAKEYGSVKQRMSTEVVTLWYKAPELLLGTRKYSTKIDIWSVGCIISELARKGNVLFNGKSEWDMMMKIFILLGTPTQNEKWCIHLPYFSPKFPKFKEQTFQNAMGMISLLYNRKWRHILFIV